MDFFESQDVARRKTTLLVVYFGLAIVAMVLVVYAVVVWALGVKSNGPLGPSPSWWQPQILAAVSAVMLGLITLGSLFKMAELRGGGEAVATMLGGRRIPPNSTDLAERRLLNVVEEMSLAAGMSVPPVYLLEGEDSINAFAAGFTPDDAVIGVNRGTLEYLDRDQLQGVMGHEFSHILNGDMRLNVRLIGLLNGILLISTIGYYMLRFGGGSGSRRSSDRKSGGGVILIVGLAAFVVGYIGLFFGRLIKAAVSRQREFLADASAVQFTRNPEGIAGALKTIGGLSRGSRMRSPEAESASHMFFASGFRHFGHSPFATHPPLAERILRIDPRFDGEFPRVRPIPEPSAASPHGPPTTFGTFAEKFGLGGKLPLDPVLVMAAAGTAGSKQVAYASQLIRTWPSALSEALHEPFSARAVVFALLLDKGDAMRGAQLALLHRHEGAPTARETERLVPLVAEQGPAGRLPMLEVAQGTLRGISREQYDRLHGTIQAMVAADAKISLFEFVLQRMVVSHLDRHFGIEPPRATRYYGLGGHVAQRAIELISALVHVGQATEDAVERAFQAAMQALAPQVKKPQLVPRGECTLTMIDKALEALALTTPGVKRRLLHAAMVAVAADGEVTVAEAELLRAVADSLDCPIPPLAAGPVTEASLTSPERPPEFE